MNHRQMRPFRRQLRAKLRLRIEAEHLLQFGGAGGIAVKLTHSCSTIFRHTPDGPGSRIGDRHRASVNDWIYAEPFLARQRHRPEACVRYPCAALTHQLTEAANALEFVEPL